MNSIASHATSHTYTICFSSSLRLPDLHSFRPSVVIPPPSPFYSFHRRLISLHKPNLFSLPDVTWQPSVSLPLTHTHTHTWPPDVQTNTLTCTNAHRPLLAFYSFTLSLLDIHTHTHTPIALITSHCSEVSSAVTYPLFYPCPPSPPPKEPSH